MTYQKIKTRVIVVLLSSSMVNLLSSCTNYKQKLEVAKNIGSVDKVPGEEKISNPSKYRATKDPSLEHKMMYATRLYDLGIWLLFGSLINGIMLNNAMHCLDASNDTCMYYKQINDAFLLLGGIGLTVGIFMHPKPEKPENGNEKAPAVLSKEHGNVCIIQNV